jgi:hypothetical protein
MGAGLRYGTGAFAIVLLVLIVAAVIPVTTRYNFDLAHPVSRVRSYAPLLDLREIARKSG